MGGKKNKSKSKSKKKKKLSKLRTALAAKQKRSFLAQRIETAAAIVPATVEKVSDKYRSTYQSKPLVGSAVRQARSIESLFYGINAIRYNDGNEQKIIIENMGEILDADYGMVDRIGAIVERADFKGDGPVQVFLPVPGGEKEAREMREKLDDADPEISRMVTFIKTFDPTGQPDQRENDDVDLGDVQVIDDASAYQSRKTFIIDSITLTEKMGEDPKKNIAFIKRSDKYKKVLKNLDQYHATVDEYRSLLAKTPDDGELYANYGLKMRESTQSLLEAIDDYTSSSRTKDEDDVKDAKKDVMHTLKDQLTATHQERLFVDPDNQEGRTTIPINRDLESARMDYWVKNYNPLLDSQKLNLPGTTLGFGANGAVRSTLFTSGQNEGTNLPAIFDAGVKMDDIRGVNPESIESGIPENNPEQSKRSVSAYAINGLLGMDAIPRTEFAMQTDKNGDMQFGQAIEVVRGIDGQVEVFDAPLPVATAASLIEFAKMGQKPPPNIRLDFENGTATPFRNVIVKVDVNNPTVQKGLSDLQVLDNVIGHADRHPSNFIYEMDSAANNMIIGVKGIDNDDTFGAVWGPSGADTKFGSKTPGLPPIIDVNTAIRILELDERTVLDMTRDLSKKLSDDDMEATIVRLLHVKDEIRKRVINGDYAATPGENVPDASMSILAKHTGSSLASLRNNIKTWGNQVADAHKESNSYLGHVKARIEVAEGKGEELPLPKYKQFDE